MLTRYSLRLCGYQHRWMDGNLIHQPIKGASKILCVARNFTHVEKERNEALSVRMQKAAIFLKPPSSLATISPQVSLNGFTDIVCETEITLLMGRYISRRANGCSKDEATGAVAGFTIGFDFTRKDLQNGLKAAGKPWELSKGFDGACPLGGFIPMDKAEGLMDGSKPVSIDLIHNDKITLSQSTKDMILSPIELIQLLSQHFSINAGDVIMTGTPMLPEQPPRLKAGDTLIARVGTVMEIRSTVV